jgi:hypothetical protein
LFRSEFCLLKWNIDLEKNSQVFDPVFVWYRTVDGCILLYQFEMERRRIVDSSALCCGRKDCRFFQMGRQHLFGWP